MFSLDISILTYWMLAASALCVAMILAIVLPQLCRVRRATTPAYASRNGLPDAAHVELPSVSVIVHTQSDCTNLRSLLPMLLEQQYPGAFEVIVVNDGGDEEVSNVVSYFDKQFNNLYMTFSPARSRNLSRRKLAITLGVKAARYDNVLLIDGNCRLVSELWLRRMMRHIAGGKEIVVGYGYTVAAKPDEAQRHRLMSYDTVRTAVQYLSSALSGNLYRAFSCNFAFKRQLFFDVKGFSKSLNLRFGVDDIFISSIARRDNFSVEISEEAMVEVVEDAPLVMHRMEKIRHEFTSRMVSRWNGMLWGLVSLAWWGWTGCSVAAIASSLPSLIPLIAATVLSLILCIPLMVTWRRTSLALHGRPLTLSVPLFFWIYPIYALVYKVLGWLRRRRNYTWSTVIH